MPQVDINYFAVLIAAIVHMIIGALWYSPVLFGKQWMKLSGIGSEKMEEMKKKGLSRAYGWSLIAAIVTAFVLAHFVDYVEARTVVAGIQTGFWIWLGFIATSSLASVLWTGKPRGLYILDTGYYLISYAVMGAILAMW